jgi:hypothetical protein
MAVFHRKRLLEKHMTDYTLSGHKCKPIARLRMEPPREWWLGELLEPIPGYPNETHCLHIKTPLKEVVLGVNQADMEMLAVLCQVVCGPINPKWLDSMVQVVKQRVCDMAVNGD